MTPTLQATRDAVRLELKFDYTTGGLIAEGIEVKVGHGIRIGTSERYFMSSSLPTLADISLLFGWVQTYVGLACRVETMVIRDDVPVADFLERVPYLSPNMDDERRARVTRLRFASPFLIHILLVVGSPPALAVLIAGAKRLFGLDLEFKGYRHRVGTEYEIARATHVEAKRIADIIERDEVPLPWTHDAHPPIDPHAANWRGRHASIGDPAEREDDSPESGETT